jgi:hypothetical protein
MVAVYFAQWACCLAAGWTRRKQIPAGKPAEGPVEWRPLLRGFLPYGLETAGAKIDVWAFSLFSAALPLGHYVGALALMTPVGLISSALTSGSTARLDWTNQREIKKYLFRTAVVLAAPWWHWPLEVGCWGGPFWFGFWATPSRVESG